MWACLVIGLLGYHSRYYTEQPTPTYSINAPLFCSLSTPSWGRGHSSLAEEVRWSRAQEVNTNASKMDPELQAQISGVDPTSILPLP